MSIIHNAAQGMAAASGADPAELLAMAGSLAAMRNNTVGPRLTDVLCALVEIIRRDASYQPRNPSLQAAADYRAALQQAVHAVYFAKVLHDQWLMGSPAPNVPPEALAAIQRMVRERARAGEDAQ